jgi:hypothetical protein
MPGPTDPVARLIRRLGDTPTPEGLVDAIVPEVADACIVFHREGTQLNIVALGHMDPAKHALLAELVDLYHPSTVDARDAIGIAAATGEGRVVSWITRQNVERASDDSRIHAVFEAVAPRSVVIAPTGDYVIVTVISDTARRFFEDDVETLRTLGTRLRPMQR